MFRSLKCRLKKSKRANALAYSCAPVGDGENKFYIYRPVRANGAATPSFDELSSVIGKLELAPPPVSVSKI
jgi:hypothetical protein